MKIYLPTTYFSEYIREIFPEDKIVVGNTFEMQNCDFLVLMGGEDVFPEYYGMDTLFPELCYFNTERDKQEFTAIEYFRRRGFPIFGICRGMQVIAAALGGRLFQDLRSQVGSGHKSYHPISMMQDPLLDVFHSGGVNSLHHQAVDRPPRNFTILAHYNNIAEAMINSSRNIFAVQFHPEFLWANGDKRAVEFFRTLREWAIRINKEKEMINKPTVSTNTYTFRMTAAPNDDELIRRQIFGQPVRNINAPEIIWNPDEFMQPAEVVELPPPDEDEEEDEEEDW